MSKLPEFEASALDRAFDQFSTGAFDEMLPEPIRVSIVEYSIEEVDGKSRRKPYQRIAEINTYVPMTVLHRMLASQERIKQLQGIRQAAEEGKMADNSQEIMLSWMGEQVWQVWKLTEPEMTYDALMGGLSFQKVFGLFQCFFGDLLKNLSQQRLTGQM